MKGASPASQDPVRSEFCFQPTPEDLKPAYPPLRRNPGASRQGNVFPFACDCGLGRQVSLPLVWVCLERPETLMCSPVNPRCVCGGLCGHFFAVLGIPSSDPLKCEPGQNQGPRREFSGAYWWTAVQVRKGGTVLEFLKCPQSIWCLDWQVSLEI